MPRGLVHADLELESEQGRRRYRGVAGDGGVDVSDDDGGGGGGAWFVPLTWRAG